MIEMGKTGSMQLVLDSQGIYDYDHQMNPVKMHLIL